MSLRVTFDIFSGRPNPSVVLDGAAATALLRKLQPTAKLSGSRTTLPTASRLGYRGLIIEQTPPLKSSTVPSRIQVAGGIAYADGSAFRVQDAAIEQFAFDQVEALRDPNLPQDLLASIRQWTAERAERPSTKAAPATSPGQPCLCAPLYEPAWWNDAASGGAKQFYNNCYNYATNYRTDTFAQPGLAAGQMYSFPISGPDMKAAATRDALTASKQSTCPKEGHLAALFVAPAMDFHWYRLGRDGLWTHKPGGMPVTNVDNSGALISDPRTADRGMYTVFCGFMVVRHGHIKIR